MTVSEIELDALAAGDDVKTDLISTKHYQYVKIADGTVDGETVIASGNGVAANALRVTTPDATVDTNNSTTTPLNANIDYPGTFTDVSAYAGITISIFADQDSDANGMKFIFSTNGTNDDMDVAGGFDYLASTGRTFQFPIQAQFFRVQFNNAGTNQTAFRLETLLHKQPVSLTSIHRLDADVVPDRSAELVKAAIVARKAGAGDFVPVQSTNGGNLKISIEEDGSATLATAANQLPDGHNVTVDNASGASAVNIQDGGNSITVDNGGTFAVQATLDAETTKVIGTVNIAAGQSITADLGANNDVTVTSGTITANLGATDNAVLDQIEVNTSYGDSVGGGTEAAALRVTLANDSTGVLSVDDNGGSLTVDGTVTANLSTTDNAVLDTIAAQQLPATSGGISTVYRDEDIDETAVAAKASGGQVYWIHCINLDATPVYLHFYDVAQGSVTVGTTAELMSFAVPSQGDANGAGFTMNFPHGVEFSTAITIACTTTIGGTAGPGVNEVILNVGYE